mmetsp:Transcript_140907/g.245552  ORF Transcript_140907/g.245552 Transcript_140907/m.245552 type:complete len:88 (+) Transcript_140907:859-1122(+)
MSVDGGHSLQNALHDLQSFWLVASPLFNLLFVDDTNCQPPMDQHPWCNGPQQAVQVMERQGAIRTLMGFSEKGGSRGLTLFHTNYAT